MFNNLTPETAQKIVTGIKGHLSATDVDRVLNNPIHTSRNASLFGFHPAAPNHVRDLAYEIELVRQKRTETVQKLEQIPSAEPPKGTLGLQRPSKTITTTNVQLVVEAIESGAQFARINEALDLNGTNGVTRLAKEGKHPNASSTLKRISTAMDTRNSKKSSTKKLLAVATV